MSTCASEANFVVRDLWSCKLFGVWGSYISPLWCLAAPLARPPTHLWSGRDWESPVWCDGPGWSDGNDGPLCVEVPAC